MRKLDSFTMNLDKVRTVIAAAGAIAMIGMMGITVGATEGATSAGAAGSGTTGTTTTETASGTTATALGTQAIADITTVTGATEEAKSEDTENKEKATTDETIKQTHTPKVSIEYQQNSTIKGTGRVVKTTLEGHYYASGVEGIAMTDQEWSLQKDAGMAMVEYFFVTTWDITQDTAPLAVNTFRIVAESELAELGPVVQINIHKTFNGVMSSLDGNPAKFTTVIGIPEDFREEGARYAVVNVKAGGYFDILPDLDEDDLTVTFKANAGNGAYAIIRYKNSNN